MYQRLFWFADKCIYAIIAVQEAYLYGRRLIHPLKGGVAYDFVRFIFRTGLSVAYYCCNQGIRKTAKASER